MIQESSEWNCDMIHQFRSNQLSSRVTLDDASSNVKVLEPSVILNGWVKSTIEATHLSILRKLEQRMITS